MDEQVQQSPKKRHQRKTLLVNRSLQFQLMGYMMLIAAMSSIVSISTRELLDLYTANHGMEGSVYLIIALSFALIVFWTFIVLLYSNRVFGPIYRLHCEIKNWRDGEKVNVIKLRKGDHLTELIDDFNELAAKHSQ